MKRLKRFFKTTLLGGLVVILPVVLTYFFLAWLYNFVTRLIEPLTRLLMEGPKIHKYIADVLVIVIIVLVCFLIGLIVKTRFGCFIHQVVEKRILKVAPGYSLFKETIKQFLGRDRTAFSAVALVQIFENCAGTMMTGFVTDEHPDGYYTVYVPSGLNPTTGLIYHLEKKYVHLLDVSVEDTMRSIISCGAGSAKLVDDFIKKRTAPAPYKSPLKEKTHRDEKKVC